MARPIDQPTTAPAFNLVEIDEDCLQATALNILFLIWRRRTTLEAFSRGIHLARRYAEQTRSKIGVCQVIEVDAVPPEADARSAFGGFLKLDVIAHSVVIHDGTGFKAASVRAIVNLQLLVSKPRFPHALFSTPEQAAASLASGQAALGRSDTPASIEALILRLRTLHRERFP